ncbi:DUF2235 domain-containing protein [Aliiglaciecola sp. LCG003]|uniref:T6SS phospholipase effector Tle1-like catalytic domain-containing protein n=1 Tax=Aliiglaciecola sp. LCG003 TaxID=3053655 RepID=UPI002572DB0B|nr:DUF2235 domain-containing protein [Aliiglaciecola sp. LCG003]WJG10298.1 DUF2235 domain-containing protein [Aliiglaciecola sp. LCG003]
MKRRIIFCLDGTWNNTFKEETKVDGSKIVKPSNILKIARAVMPIDASGNQQIVYYSTGIGSSASYPGIANNILSKIDNITGGIWGAGLETKLEEAINFLTNNYSTKANSKIHDEVFIFGFSRGAATARAICQFLAWMGFVLDKRDAYFLPHFIRKFFKSRNTGSGLQFLQELKTNHPNAKFHPTKDITINFLGVFDTVLSLGSRLFLSEPNPFLNRQAVPNCISKAVQALAVDESRLDFHPNIWTKHSEHQTLKQRWFPGVHSNIGGGYPNDGLANCSLHWLIHEARSLGAAFDADYLGKYRPWFGDTLYDSNTGPFVLLDKIRRRSGVRNIQLAEQHVNLSYFVFERMMFDSEKSNANTYRPHNVIEYLQKERVTVDKIITLYLSQGYDFGNTEELNPQNNKLIQKRIRLTELLKALNINS